MSERIRDMLFERRHRHLPGHAPRRAYCRLDGWRLIVGVQSAHRTSAARKWRTQLRLIRARAAAEIGRGMGGSNVRVEPTPKAVGSNEGLCARNEKRGNDD